MKRPALALAMLLAGALAACAHTGSNAPMGLRTAPAGELELRQEMRKLWSDHVIWTRGYIVSAVANDGGAEVALGRLMKNQEDIGSAIAPFYGNDAGTQLTNLLKDHIRIAGEVVGAAKSDDQSKLADANRRWYANAAEIASFLNNANPSWWSKPDLQVMLNHHLALTTQEATARIKQDWATDASTFDQVFQQAMEMADALSEGILKQFPVRT